MPPLRGITHLLLYFKGGVLHLELSVNLLQVGLLTNCSCRDRQIIYKIQMTGFAQTGPGVLPVGRGPW
jgi:hypothetical protein